MFINHLSLNGSYILSKAAMEALCVMELDEPTVAMVEGERLVTFDYERNTVLYRYSLTTPHAQSVAGGAPSAPWRIGCMPMFRRR